MILQSPPVLVSFSKEVLVDMLEMDPKVVETQVTILNIIHKIFVIILNILLSTICMIFEQISSIPIVFTQDFADWVGGQTVLEGSQPMAHRLDDEPS